MKAVQVPATLEGVALLKDGGVSLRFHTQELNVEEVSAINICYQQFGYLLFGNDKDQQLPEEPLYKELGGKSPSQRMRSVMYVLYQQSRRTDLTFDEFYARRMEQLIEYLKTKLV